jgi:hypothetical protein
VRGSLAALLLLAAAGCAGGGGGGGTSAPPPSGEPVSWKPTKEPGRKGLEFFGRRFEAGDRLLLVAKSVKEEDAALAARCEAHLTGLLSAAGIGVFDPATLQRVREQIRVEERLKGRSPAEVAKMLADLDADGLVTVWIDSVSSASFRGAFRGDCVASFTATDARGERFGSWASPPFDERNPPPLRETEADARLAALDLVLGSAARQLGLGREDARVGDSGALGFGAPVVGPRVPGCLAVGMDEARREVFAVTATEVLVLEAGALGPAARFPLPGRAEWARLCVPRRALFCGAGDAVHRVSLDDGASTGPFRTSAAVTCADATDRGDACFGLADGAVAVLPWDGTMVEGGRGTAKGVRAVALASAEGSVAVVSEPETGTTEIGLRGPDLLPRGEPLRIAGEGGGGIVELITPKAVGIGRTAEIVAVSCRRTSRSLRSGRQEIDGLLAVVSGSTGRLVKRLEGEEFADIESLDLHPGGSRFLAVGNEYTNAGYGNLSILDALTGSVLATVRLPGVRRLAFSNSSSGPARGAFVCVWDSEERVELVPLSEG